MQMAHAPKRNWAAMRQVSMRNRRRGGMVCSLAVASLPPLIDFKTIRCVNAAKWNMTRLTDEISWRHRREKRIVPHLVRTPKRREAHGKRGRGREAGRDEGNAICVAKEKRNERRVVSRFPSGTDWINERGRDWRKEGGVGEEEKGRGAVQ